MVQQCMEAIGKGKINTGIKLKRCTECGSDNLEEISEKKGLYVCNGCNFAIKLKRKTQ